MGPETGARATRLAEVAARFKAASPGPWFWTAHDGAPWGGDGDRADNLISGAYGVNGGVLGTDFRRPCAEDADFIAHAPEDVRYLLALVATLTEERDALREALTTEHYLLQRAHIRDCSALDRTTSEALAKGHAALARGAALTGGTA